VADDVRVLNGEYVLVEGSFDAEQKGHWRAFKGMLTNISRIERSYPLPQ
jgi:hypothetical protein